MEEGEREKDEQEDGREMGGVVRKGKGLQKSRGTSWGGGGRMNASTHHCTVQFV